MSESSRAKSQKQSVADLKKIGAHPSTLGPYVVKDDKVFRAFGPGSILVTRDKPPRRYQVELSGAFTRLDKALSRRDRHRQEVAARSARRAK